MEPQHIHVILFFLSPRQRLRPMMHNSELNKTALQFSYNKTYDCHGDGKNASCVTEIGRKGLHKPSDRSCLIYVFTFSRFLIGIYTIMIYCWVDKTNLSPIFP